MNIRVFEEFFSFFIFHSFESDECNSNFFNNSSPTSFTCSAKLQTSLIYSLSKFFIIHMMTTVGVLAREAHWRRAHKVRWKNEKKKKCDKINIQTFNEQSSESEKINFVDFLRFSLHRWQHSFILLVLYSRHSMGIVRKLISQLESYLTMKNFPIPSIPKVSSVENEGIELVRLTATQR